jgi:hypothetical protein
MKFCNTDSKDMLVLSSVVAIMEPPHSSVNVVSRLRLDGQIVKDWFLMWVEILLFAIVSRLWGLPSALSKGIGDKAVTTYC